MTSIYPAYNTVPASFDLDFLEAQSNIQILGTGTNEDGDWVITYDNPVNSGNFTTMTETIAAYEINYLVVALPLRIAEVKSIRDDRIKGFVFNGLRVELDLETKANIVGCMMGLDRNPDVAGIDWSLGDGQFIFLPRQVVGMLADAMFMHVQSCFSISKAKVGLLKQATTLTELEAVDISSGWPS